MSWPMTRHDPRQKEGWIVCLFDLQCYQLAKIMGHLWAVPWKRYLLKTNWNISAEPNSWLNLVRVQAAFWVLRRDLYQFLQAFRTQKANRSGKLLAPYLTAPLFVHFLLLDAPAPAPLASSHYWQHEYILDLCNYSSLTSTSSIFKCHKIVHFVMSTFSHNWHLHRSIIMHRNDT